VIQPDEMRVENGPQTGVPRHDEPWETRGV